MKRYSFLRLSLALGAMLTAPLTMFAKLKVERGDNKGFKVDAGKDRFGKSITLFDGDTFYTKVSATDTDGGMYVFESTRIKEGGPILHTHYETDEWWYILQGEFLVRVGDNTYSAKAGDFIFGPRNVPHTFAKVGPGEAKVIICHQPAGKMEAYFKKISEGVAAGMTEAERDQLRKDHGFERVGPPITYLKQ